MDHRFIILGAGGQLGREWIQQLVMLDEQVHAYAYEDLDITDSDALERILDHVQPTVLVNAAAYTKVDQAESDSERAKLLNTIVPGRIAAMCRERSILFVHYSTDYIFGGSEIDRTSYPEGFSEGQSANPINVYGQTKWDGERLIQVSGCEYLIVRTSWLCGRYGHNFVKTMIRLASEKDRIRVVNDQFGVPSFADNVVRNTLALIKENQRGVFHLTSLGLCSWSEFATEILKIYGSKSVIDAISSSEYVTQAQRPAFSLLNCEKAEQVPGVILEHWNVGLQRLMDQLELEKV